MHCILVNFFVNFLFYDIIKTMIIIKRGKLKNIRLKITPEGDLVVSAPKNTSDKEIENIINQKQNWINKTTNLIKAKRLMESKYNFSEYIYIFSTPYIYKGNRAQIYVDAFYNHVVPLLNHWVEITGLEYKNLKIINSKRVWGMMSDKKMLKLNLVLVILPQNLCEYVIIHELCHIKEMNHSRNFWALVEQFCPNYKQLRKELKLYSFLLEKQNIF